MASRAVTLAYMCWALAAAFLVASLACAMGASTPLGAPLHKMLLLHLPVAVSALLGAAVVFVAAVGQLLTSRRTWDDLGHAAASVTVLNATILLVTGMFWAKAAWGHWWMWSPRLTFSLILWALYAGLLLVRTRISDPSRRASVSAVYGVVAFFDVPLLYLSAKLLPDVHPTDVKLASGILPALSASLIGITLFSIGTIAARFELGRVISRLDGGPTNQPRPVPG